MLSIVPATGLYSESVTYPKGTFKARTSKGIFSQFLVFRIRLRKMSAETGGSLRTEDAYCCASFRAQRQMWGQPPSAVRRAQLDSLPEALPSPLPKTVQLWKSS